MKDKIALVCQRYGLEVNGGSELYCRRMAEKLREIYDVEIYTTCAVDYLSWENEYTSGIDIINGITVFRFQTSKTRELESFNAFTKQLYSNPAHTDQEEMEWIEREGPICPDLLQELSEKHKEYRAVIFMTYEYYLTVKGLLSGFNNALLVPTLHDEPAANLRCFDKVFEAPKGIIWNSPEERAFGEKRFPVVRKIPGVMAGIGVDLPEDPWPDLPEQLSGETYLVYVGRICKGKRCGKMCNFFQKYKKQYGGALKLVLVGKEDADMEAPEDPDIIKMGFVSEEMKFSIMKSARALVLFSKYESLSMVVLESMTVGRPVLVNGQSEVLKGHCIRSGAGRYFEDYPQFAAELNALLTDDVAYASMCENGKKYVNDNYQWKAIIEKIQSLIDTLPGDRQLR